MASSKRLSFTLIGGEDVIVARATSEGPGALAIVRLSGLGLRELLPGICPELDLARPRLAQYVRLLDSEGEEIDEIIGIFYAAPKSFTGEDSAELILHASPFLVESALAAAVKAGARRAVPGEFSRRAVSNGKMDLTQAEAVHQLIQAETAWQARLAREQLHGKLSGKIEVLRKELLNLLAMVEASLDYVEQGVLVDDGVLMDSLSRSLDALKNLLGSVEAGRRLRSGTRVVILGPPNAGKSSLFNRLCREEKAIVAAGPGTTRDLVEAHVEIEGVPVELVDTAGLRTSEDEVEQEGISRARGAARDADLILLLTEGSAPFEESAVGHRTPMLKIRNKMDLYPDVRGREGELLISARTGAGLEMLIQEVHQRVLQPLENIDGGIALNSRQAECLGRAKDYLGFPSGEPGEIMAERIHLALKELDEVIGVIGGEEVLDRVFSSFCLGK